MCHAHDPRPHRGKAQGLSTFVVGVLMFYASLLTGDELFFYFCVAWLLAVINQRLTSASFRKRFKVHSQYSGRPWLAAFLGCKDEGMARLIVEPLICFGTGLFMAQWSLNLGKLIGSAGASLMLVELICRRATEEREQAVVDAWLESEELERGVHDKLGF